MCVSLYVFSPNSTWCTRCIKGSTSACMYFKQERRAKLIAAILFVLPPVGLNALNDNGGTSYQADCVVSEFYCLDGLR